MSATAKATGEKQKTCKRKVRQLNVTFGADNYG
jgi:hypothetical protein